jgi:hypothetical protein
MVEPPTIITAPQVALHGLATLLVGWPLVYLVPTRYRRWTKRYLVFARCGLSPWSFCGVGASPAVQHRRVGPSTDAWHNWFGDGGLLVASSVRVGRPARQAPRCPGSEASRQAAGCRRSMGGATPNAGQHEVAQRRGGHPFKEPAPLDGEGAGVTVQERGRTTRTESKRQQRRTVATASKGYQSLERLSKLVSWAKRGTRRDGRAGAGLRARPNATARRTARTDPPGAIPRSSTSFPLTNLAPAATTAMSSGAFTRRHRRPVDMDMSSSFDGQPLAPSRRSCRARRRRRVHDAWPWLSPYGCRLL